MHAAALLSVHDSADAGPAAAPQAHAVPEVSPQRQRSLARAAQQDILRRLTPLLRAEMLVRLECLGMLAEAVNARMDRGAAAPGVLQESVPKLNRLSREAVAQCVEVCSWMAPEEDEVVVLREGVAQLVRLLSTSLNFRGFELRIEDGEDDVHVNRTALRFLLTAAILTLADGARGPGDLALHIERSATHGVVTVSYQPRQDAAFTQLHEAGETPLSWTELQAFAAQHACEMVRNGRAIVLRLPPAQVTSPLAMIPV